MKVWHDKIGVIKEREIEQELHQPQPSPWPVQCIYGPHQAEVLHRGTAYCRSCYDARNPFGKLIDP